MDREENMADEYTLYNGGRIPAIGYGTYLTDKAITEDCVLRALETGYRHIDTAAFYGNERETGNAVRRSGLRREEVFVTPDWEMINLETWQALTELYEAGKVRAIGVSNFLPHHLDALIKTKVPPMTNQIEFNPGVKQPETTAYCKEHGLLVEAWSPLGRGRMLGDERLAAVARKYGITVAQLCIAWCLARGTLPLPKTTDTARMRENFAAASVKLSDEDVSYINSLPPFGAGGRHPDVNGF